MHYLLLVISGIIMGLIAAVPIGPVNLICIRRSFAFGPVNGFVSGLGAALGDGVFAAITGLGLTWVAQLIEGYAKRESKSYRVLWTSEPLHDLALNVSGKVPARDAAAVTRAFVEMANDPRGREIMVRASKLVGLPENTRFIASDGHEYATYRNFFKTAPLSLQ